MGQKGESDQDAENEESGVAVFAEGSQDHPMEMPFRILSDKKKEPFPPISSRTGI
jgi:hypothetical protein